MCAANNVDNYWLNTIRQNLLLLNRSRLNTIRSWEQTRYIAFAVFHAARSANGSKLYNYDKPNDLFGLETDVTVEHKRDESRALAALEKHKANGNKEAIDRS